MVAAANPLAAEAGYEVLRSGGSAIDAAIAVQMVLNLVEPQSSGIGGGTFLLHHDARTGRLEAYDGRETAPGAARPGRFLDSAGRPMPFREAVLGGRSVGVPGTLRALELAHREHGRVPWPRLFEPAIRLAEEGFPVSPRLHALLAAERYLTLEPARSYFRRPDGAPLAVGDVLRNPELAATLRLIAREGAEAFYRGDVARDIVRAVASHPTSPGDLAEEDLAAYRARKRAPACGAYRVWRVCSMPLPSSGGPTLLQLLGMLERFELPSLAPGSFFAVHLFSEAGRLAYADRDRYMADPDFAPPPPGLTDPGYLRERSALIRADATLGRAQPGDPRPVSGRREAHAPGAAWRAWADGETAELPSTSHVSIVDANGNALSMTSSIEDAFGSRLMVRGFLLNNQLTDFSFLPERDGRPVANRVEPGKRPRSSMAPTIVYDRAGRVHAVAGSPGGSAIINYVAKTLVAMLDWRLDPQAAVDLPNVGSRNLGFTELEAGTGAEALAGKLRAIGHEVRLSEQTSGVQAILRTPRGWAGGADPRREGAVRGD